MWRSALRSVSELENSLQNYNPVEQCHRAWLSLFGLSASLAASSELMCGCVFDIARESIHVCGTMGRKIPAWTNSSKAHEGLCTSLESWGARYWLRGAMWCRHVCYILARTLVAVQIRAPV